MAFGKILSFIFFLVVVSLLVVYWFIPFNTTEFFIQPGNSNFSLESTENQGEMQFYPDMRYPNPQISYKIDSDCSMQKRDDMERAFEIIAEESVLQFYPVNSNEEISVACEDKQKFQRDTRTFIAGEGGPTNITKTENFNVILHGDILLLRDFKCNIPNVGIHELLHALGFEHSTNPNNILYSVTKCGQEIGDDTISLINELYSTPTYADLAFEDVSAIMNGKYLGVEISVRNHGLKDSEDTKILIYVDGKQAKEIELESIEIGYGRVITLTNIWVPKISVHEIEFVIDSDFSELNRENNKVLLEIKK